ncbi:MAG: hypothetical protein JO314_10095 [Acidobacteria bacterium]|nr:hypothetical protein [Acidobacteriota bacterium]
MKRLTSLTLLVLTVFVVSSAAQDNIIVAARKPMAVAVGNNLYCAGYIQSGAISTANKIIGAQDEADKYNFSQNDYMYINMGNDKGVRVGDIFSVVRPRGAVKSKWSSKGGLGFYVQEVGALEVVDVKPSVSVVKIKASCDAFYLGDLVQLSETRVSPIAENRPPLNRFADATGKPAGRILMSRDGAESLARDFIAYVDLGADDHVKVGDHLTIYRALERGNINTLPEHEIVSSRDYGFESDRYKGGKFSNQSPRKSGDNANGKEVTTAKAKDGRPALRKVVGEAVILNVREKTATVVITRTGQEIHTGDYVEIQ